MPLSMKERVHRLTPRQREVVRLTSLGYSVFETAAILDVAESTADNHRAAAMKILSVGNQMLLTRIAIKYRISPLDDELTRAEKRKLSRA